MKRCVQQVKITQYQTVEENQFTTAVPKLLQQIYHARGLTSDADIDYSLQHLAHFSSLKDIDTAVDLLVETFAAQHRIVIVGDFDVDGATSTALLMRGLKQLGAKHLNFLVPNRMHDGYGLTPKIVDLAHNTYTPELIITVDNGIASIEGVEHANSLGVKVLITDHHLPGLDLPDAVSIVNPNQHGCSFPSKNLAGVGVAFYLLLALRDKLQQHGWFEKHGIKDTNLAQHLDLVALGTVADLVKLDYNNRILVQQGLARIRAGKCCYGIQSLLRIAGATISDLSSNDIGFALAPRLNAAGRLDDISIGIRCLLADNMQQASEYALTLENLNKQRKTIQKQMYNQAKQEAEQLEIPSNTPSSLCLVNDSWHQGLVGIIASNVKDSIYRPTIVFTSISDSELVGSARSIDGLHIRDALEAVAIARPDILTKFGGHAMAAGLTIAKDKYSEFVTEFNQHVSKALQAEHLIQTHYTDGKLDAEYLNLETANMLRLAAPWGKGFEQPIFCDDFAITNYKLIADHHVKLSLRHQVTGQILDAIWFYAKLDKVVTNRTLQCLYQLDVQTYLGNSKLQLIIQHID